MLETDLEVFIARACELGAVEAKLILATSVVTAPWVRMKCRFGCGSYNTSHCCPPNTPTHRETQEILNCYHRALLIRCANDEIPTMIVTRLEREIFLAGYYKALGLGAGPCNLCEKCNPTRCLHPKETRPSMESCGIDVFATVRANGYPIDVLVDRSCGENSYGLVLID